MSLAVIERRFTDHSVSMSSLSGGRGPLVVLATHLLLCHVETLRTTKFDLPRGAQTGRRSFWLRHIGRQRGLHHELWRVLAGFFQILTSHVVLSLADSKLTDRYICLYIYGKINVRHTVPNVVTRI